VYSDLKQKENRTLLAAHKSHMSSSEMHRKTFTWAACSV